MIVDWLLIYLLGIASGVALALLWGAAEANKE